MWKSTDGAATWSPAAGSHADVTSPIFVTGLFAMAIDPVTPSALYVSGIPVISGTRSGGGVSKSTDGSQRWHSINAGLGNLDARAAAVDPTDPSIVYVGTHGGGVFALQQSETTEGCASIPLAGCRTPGASVLQLDQTTATLSWSWLRGAATSFTELGNPRSGPSGYHLCIYDAADGVPHLVLRLTAPPGYCEDSPGCWQQTDTPRSPAGYVYASATLTVRLTAGGLGRARIAVSGALPPLPLVQSPQVTAQLVKDDGGACWEARYAAPATKNTAERFTDALP